MNAEDWIAALQADPRFLQLDVRHEIARCDHWSRREFKKPAGRARILNWLKKVEKVRAARAAGATYASGLRPPPPIGPPGWFEWFAGEFARVGEDDPAHGQLLAAHSCKAFHMLPGSWRARAAAACLAPAAQ